MDECGQKLNFQFEPGTKYQYSGEGFEYLRKALEKKFKNLWNNLPGIDLSAASNA
jgi:hypothetical protein